ncbi:carboxypeptidase-like regulatory domain-containing protein [Brumimicrobium glaciale]|uniref:Carboxypeptidase-like regulatory domain-containing protein n=1 Tax=Brumimicrobium glaciale TaxID=200475 RepID=A0A4Q4KJB8_9FLAO|nr:DUF5686 family protein [Brumimicrobium glaciale]RYM32364.1 carboxypeptidase-like regulatory domain-containing protein [Brumimicrobium glaciale]
MFKFLQYFVLTACFLFGSNAFGQYVLKGKVLDESNLGIPYADVYVKNNADLRTRADIEGNYLMRLEVGEYYMVFSALGYETREHYMIVRETENIQNIQLFPIKIKDLEEYDFSVKRRNVGRDIVLRTVEKKNQFDYNQFPYTSDVYIRAKDERTLTSKGEDTSEKDQEKQEEDARFDDVEEMKRKKMQQLNNLNMVEVEMQRSYAPPNKIKEIRTGYEKRGNDRNLYFTTTAKSNFNFFQNTLYLDDLSKSPIQSPISTAGILSYKYQLVEKIERESLPTLNKIQISSRSSSISTLEGFIYIQDSTWLVEKIDFTIVKGNLYIYDNFSIVQDFEILGDTMCVLKNQYMNYNVEYRKEKFVGSTVVNYKNYDFKPDFEKGFFGNELAVTTQQAYERDSSYWSSTRLTPLTLEEQKFIQQRDSIENLFSKSTYLDSVDSVFNKVTFWKVAWFGIDHRNRVKKTQWTISSVAAMVRPIYIAGPRVGPDFDFFKKWDNEKTVDVYMRADVGLLNGDVKGYANIKYLYNPFKQSRIGINFTHNYDLIRSFDAITQVFLRDNFIERTSTTLYHDFEIFNGLYLESNFTYINRRPLPDDTKFIRWFDKALENTEPPKFNAYNALIADFTLRYTPFQKYMREPNRKVILGSKWPTIYAYYEKGVPSLIGSEVNHDYIRFGLMQTFKVLTLGTSKYHITSGKFLNQKILRPEDMKYHRRADPIWFSNPMYSYQDLDSTLPTMDWYFESHYIHHFNGALINKIPFMKKTRISTVVGGGYLWVPEHKWTHYEMFGGLERVFKFSRRRLRIGVYAAFSDGNQIKPRSTFKISFAILDERSMKFSF